MDEELTHYLQNAMSDKEALGGHSYVRHYVDHLGAFKDHPVKILELGIGFGPACSLYAWARFFQNGSVAGIDARERPDVQHDRVQTFCGDQADTEFLGRVVAEAGPFDIIIDDASHLCDKTQETFRYLFPNGLWPGGVYVIEDLQTAYWPKYGGGPPGATGTHIRMIKDLVDSVNCEEFDPRPDCPFDGMVDGVHVYHNIAFIQKAR